LLDEENCTADARFDDLSACIPCPPQPLSDPTCENRCHHREKFCRGRNPGWTPSATAQLGWAVLRHAGQLAIPKRWGPEPRRCEPSWRCEPSIVIDDPADHAPIARITRRIRITRRRVSSVPGSAGRSPH